MGNPAEETFHRPDQIQRPIYWRTGPRFTIRRIAVFLSVKRLRQAAFATHSPACGIAFSSARVHGAGA